MLLQRAPNLAPGPQQKWDVTTPTQQSPRAGGAVRVVKPSVRRPGIKLGSFAQQLGGLGLLPSPPGSPAAALGSQPQSLVTVPPSCCRYSVSRH